MTTYWARRIRRHAALVLTAAIIVWIGFSAAPPPDFRHRLSLSTAYAAMIFLAVTLALGPWKLLTRKPNPVSFDLRRDLGIWAGILALVHTGVGLTVHLRGRMWMYFFRRLHSLAIQNTKFGEANYILVEKRHLPWVIIFAAIVVITAAIQLAGVIYRRRKSQPEVS